MSDPTLNRQPTSCPVCRHDLTVSRLSCTHCGTELSGVFAQCQFCALDESDLELITVFLRSRGNLKEVERFLGVSYPTARARFGEVLAKLGLADAEPTDDAPATGLPSREEILAEVSSGALSPAEAQTLLRALDAAQG